MYSNKIDVEPPSNRVTAQTRNLVELVLVMPNVRAFSTHSGAIPFYVSGSLLIRPAKLKHLIRINIPSLRHEAGRQSFYFYFIQQLLVRCIDLDCINMTA